MIEVDYAPGTTLGARGAELAVLADIGSGDPLAQELVTLLNQPGTGIRQVLELLAPGGVPRVQDFAVAEAIGPSRTRVVLRGWAGVRAGELRLEARGTWRGSTVNGPEVELYDASGVPQARHHRLQTGVVRASVLRIRLEAAGPSRGAAGGTGAANGPRRALPPPQPDDEPAGDGSAGGVLRLDSGDGLGLDQDYVLGGEPAIPADWNHHHSDPVLVHLSGERISGGMRRSTSTGRPCASPISAPRTARRCSAAARTRSSGWPRTNRSRSGPATWCGSAANGRWPSTPPPRPTTRPAQPVNPAIAAGTSVRFRTTASARSSSPPSGR